METLCSGFLKVRGTRENIINFCFNGLKVPKENISNKKIEDLVELVGEYDEYFRVKEKCYINGTTNGFIEPCETCLGKKDDYDDVDPIIISLDASFDWNVDKEELRKISEECRVDINFHGFQDVELFEVIVEIINGVIIDYRTIDYFTYNDWKWKCINAVC